jgi:hypothetical protein
MVLSKLMDFINGVFRADAFRNDVFLELMDLRDCVFLHHLELAGIFFSSVVFLTKLLEF